MEKRGSSGIPSLKCEAARHAVLGENRGVDDTDPNLSSEATVLQVPMHGYASVQVRACSIYTVNC